MSCSLGFHPKTDEYVGIKCILRGTEHDKGASDSAKELFLSPELISEILSWLPVKSIQRLKCVCRTWLSMAEDRGFIDKHMARAPDYFWAVEEGDGHLIGNICRGLILEKTDPNSNYRLRNPSTKRALDLPHHNERDEYYTALYFISSTKTFKLIFPFTNGRLNGRGSFRILTVGVDDEWRTVDFPFECSQNLTGRLRHEWWVDLVEGLYVFVIWPVTESERHEPDIVTLEVESETVRRMSIPQRAGLFSNWSHMGLMDWARKPSVYQMSDNELLRVWVVEDCEKQKWAEEMIAVDMKPVKDLIADYRPYRFYGNQIRMYHSERKSFWFDIVSNVVTHINSPTTPAMKWRASLMEIKGMKPLA